MAYFFDWFIQAASSVAYFLTIFEASMYFLGMCLYIPALIDDLRGALNDLNETLVNRPITNLDGADAQRALASEITYHVEVIK